MMPSPINLSDIEAMEPKSDIDAMKPKSDIDAMEPKSEIDAMERSYDDAMEIESVGIYEEGQGSPVSLHPEQCDTLEPPTVRGIVPVTRRAGHLKSAMTHCQARDATCVLCWRKSDLLVNNDTAVKIIANTHHNLFDINDLSHPSGICNTCIRNLNRLASNSLGKRKDPCTDWRKKNLQSILIPDGTVTTNVCSKSGCPICTLARFNPVSKPGVGDIYNWVKRQKSKFQV